VVDVHRLVSDMWEKHGRIDVAVSNAGYGLFGCAEELTDADIDKIIATNLTGSIAFIRSMLPGMRKQGGGRIIQISSYGGQVAFAANSLYHATKFGIEGFCESVAQEVAQFGIGMTIVEPGGARTEFRYGSAHVANLMPEYESCHGFLNMLDASKGLAPGDPAKMAARIIESVDKNPAPLRMVLGSQALTATIDRLEERVADYKTQTYLAASTDFENGD
jgi:NAD(P)-dependent dehydrogenase (short-subunit alcohol dehydrogenase family)